MCTKYVHDVCIKLQTKDLKNVKYNAWHWSICKNRYCRLIQLISVQPCDGVWKSSLSGAASIQPGTQTGCYYKLPTQQSHPITFNYCLGCCFSMHTCEAASVPQKESAKKNPSKKNSMRHRSTYSQHAAGAERSCMLCRQRHFAHMHVHAPHCSRACWPSCGRAKKRRPTKNSSHCDRSTDIYSLVAQTCPAAYSCVCVCVTIESQSVAIALPPACSFNKDRLGCENAAEWPTLGGCYDNQKSLETRKQTAWLLRGS